MAFDLNLPLRTGIYPVDLDSSQPKGNRIGLTLVGTITTREDSAGKHDWKSKQASDPANAFILKADNSGGALAPRGGYGSWSFCVPMVKEKKGWRPLADTVNSDVDFEYTHPTIFSGGQAVPEGTVALITATTGHGTRELVGVVAGGGSAPPIISDWLSDKPPAYSTLIHDMDGPVLSQIRKAGFHTFTRVMKWGEPCSLGKTVSPGQDKYAVALNGTQSADKTGGLFATFNTAEALLSEHYFGPLGACSRKDHTVAFGDRDIRSGRINTAALYGGGSHREGPLPFEEIDEPRVSTSVFPVRTFLQWRPKYKRNWLCGTREGRWDLHTRIPVAETPPCNPSKVTEPPGSDGNPRDTFPTATTTYTPGFYGSQGIDFMPRPGALLGKPISQP